MNPNGERIFRSAKRILGYKEQQHQHRTTIHHSLTHLNQMGGGGGGEEEESEKVCDTELCLSSGGRHQNSGSSSSSSSASSASASASRRGKATEEKQEEDGGKITMFYDERIYVGDVTEIQARDKISMATRNDIERRPQGAAWGSNATAALALATAVLLPPPLSSDRSLSLKRSLQRFLEKRKARSLQASSSHYRHDHHPPF